MEGTTAVSTEPTQRRTWLPLLPQASPVIGAPAQGGMMLDSRDLTVFKKVAAPHPRGRSTLGRILCSPVEKQGEPGEKQLHSLAAHRDGPGQCDSQKGLYTDAELLVLPHPPPPPQLSLLVNQPGGGAGNREKENASDLFICVFWRNRTVCFGSGCLAGRQSESESKQPCQAHHHGEMPASSHVGHRETAEREVGQRPRHAEKCTACLPMPGCRQAPAMVTQTQAPEQSVEASVWGSWWPGCVGDVVTSLWGQRKCLWRRWLGVASSTMHGRFFARQIGCRGWQRGRDSRKTERCTQRPQRVQACPIVPPLATHETSDPQSPALPQGKEMNEQL
ncbi:hypothetical protein P7K49_002381 [Saguinus oedipus]|uniref:Uncharacterized protein n=1 Tax=Saguinus oedipus TaxID=9490 RepID=A0ABQ9WH59_SAGOE|nr:hypothetical protein P7K49_002381 [Saguinus oedipus]